MRYKQINAAFTWPQTCLDIFQCLGITFEVLQDLKRTAHSSPQGMSSTALSFLNVGDAGDKHMLSLLELLVQREKDA